MAEPALGEAEPRGQHQDEARRPGRRGQRRFPISEIVAELLASLLL